MSAPQDGKVYFAKCYAYDGYDLNMVKIGCSENPEARVKAVKIGQPFTLELVTYIEGDLFMEHFMHMWLRKDRVSGEFFHWRGETSKLIEGIKAKGEHPFPIKWSANEGYFTTLDVIQFMDRHNITVADVCKASEIKSNAYELLLKEQRCGNRRFLAALSVTAVKRGISIDWPADFRAADPKRIAA